ncbi:Borealin N terminal-domain-containing protein [Jimgerdemannia flammicorona]|uniref:Borealin N terminal-domain-containing protein n=1 Tax=Jimgerdemannia flammicorona TaxID=994334 RepID=A0A433DC92_9FUNG|nr:Borealin N terminal-domain-containing protein [Jimgerdemannia flammicorona]
MPPKRITKKPLPKVSTSSQDTQVASDNQASKKRTIEDTQLTLLHETPPEKKGAQVPSTPTKSGEGHDVAHSVKKPKLDEGKQRDLLENLEIEVQERCRKLESHLTTLAANLRARGKMEQARLPEAVRKMSVREFVEMYDADVKLFYDAQARKRTQTIAIRNESSSLTRALAEKRLKEFDKKQLKELEAVNEVGVLGSENEAGKKNGRGVKPNPVSRHLTGLENVAPINVVSPRKTRRQRILGSVATEEQKPPADKLKRGKTTQPADKIAATPSGRRSHSVLTEIHNRPAAESTPASKQHLAPITSASTPIMHAGLSQTPASQRRRPRRGESIQSVNGSPLENPLGEEAKGDDESVESSPTLCGDKNFGVFRRGSSIKPIALPLEDGTVLSLDPATQSPSSAKGLGPVAKRKLAEKMAAYEAHLAACQAQVDRWKENLGVEGA